MQPLRPACLLLLTVAACSAYDPPVRTDRTTEKYQTDLEDCRKTASRAAYLKSAGDIFTWIVSPITDPPRIRAGMRSCLTAKGYVLEH